MPEYDAKGPVYSVSQLLAGFNGGDILTLLTTSQSRAALLSLDIQQVPGSTAPLAHPMAVEVFRGTTSTAGGATALTPVNREGYSGAKASNVSAFGPGSAGNSTASTGIERVYAGGLDASGGKLCWEPCPPPTMGVSDSLHVRASTSLVSTAGVGLAVTATFRELGKMPV